MEFLDFDVRIDPGREGAYKVTVVQSPAGEQSSTVSSLKGDAVLERLQGAEAASRGIDPATGSSRGSRTLALGGPAVLGRSEASRELGRDLFDLLLAPEVRGCYRTSLVLAREQGQGLRLRLRIDPPELAALPWEYLYDDEEGDFVCLARETPVVRHLEVGRPVARLEIDPPLRILGMVASPSNLSALDVAREKEQIAASIEHLVEAGYLTLTWVEGQSWRDLQGMMRGGPWHVFHFIGHGGFDKEASEGLLMLVDEDNAEGRARQLSATQLGRLLADHPSIRLVVLNSCEGARSEDEDIFSSVGATLIRRGVPAVISMQYEISDRAALEFSRTFYDSLAEALPVDAAVSEARKAISMAVDDTVEWATPVLHMRSPDGVLFDLDVARAVLGDDLRAVEPVSRDNSPATESSPSIATDTDPGLQILLSKVKQQWIEGVLEASLKEFGLLNLDVDEMHAAVDSPWGSIPLTPAKSLVDVFDEVGGSFLVLGVPGVGKTTSVLSLTRDLLGRAEADPERRVPVVFKLSSWKGQSMPKWLTEELSSKYLIPKHLSRGWLEAHRLQLVLDGLDEVAAGSRAACVEAINELTAAGAGVVVSSRLDEYLELSVRLGLNGAIQLRKLSRERVLACVEAAGPTLAGLRNTLERDYGLLVLARTPFMLSLMIRTYRDLDPSTLATEQFATVEGRKRQLIAAYVKREFRRTEGSPAYA